MNFVVVTGLSGSGKTCALHALEDIGYYCVDNIPPVLIPVFYDLCDKSNDKNMKNVAIVTDIRGGEVFDSLYDALKTLSRNKQEFKILFIETKEDILLLRYRQTRRKHPLSDTSFGSTETAIANEIKLLSPLKEMASYIIDSSYLTPSQLKERITTLFLGNIFSGLTITCISFGFKYGIPLEADLVFDVRCLPNPFYIKELKNLTGLDDDVREYVMKWDQTKGLLKRIIDYLDYSMPLYKDEGKSNLVIAIGCTGGKHRSVTLSGKIFDYLIEKGQRVLIHHRDIWKV
ncbi:MAG: RNase adapter RapZ [Bacillota bacterium]|nr:RNase adapter RapZ [Bacillota bacterium]